MIITPKLGNTILGMISFSSLCVCNIAVLFLWLCPIAAIPADMQTIELEAGLAGWNCFGRDSMTLNENHPRSFKDPGDSVSFASFLVVDVSWGVLIFWTCYALHIARIWWKIHFVKFESVVIIYIGPCVSLTNGMMDFSSFMKKMKKSLM